MKTAVYNHTTKTFQYYSLVQKKTVLLEKISHKKALRIFFDAKECPAVYFQDVQ
jgi:hypothetical protein